MKRVRKFQIFNYMSVLFCGEFTVCITSVIITKIMTTIQVILNTVILHCLLFDNKFSSMSRICSFPMCIFICMKPNTYTVYQTYFQAYKFTRVKLHKGDIFLHFISVTLQLLRPLYNIYNRC
jgi:hypothetical protein